MVIDTDVKIQPEFRIKKNLTLKPDDCGLEFNAYGGTGDCDDFKSKLLYLICYAANNTERMAYVVKAAKEVAEEQGITIKFPKGVEDGTYDPDDWEENYDFYINHQSSDSMDWVFDTFTSNTVNIIKHILTDNRIQIWLCSDGDRRYYDLYDPYNKWIKLNDAMQVESLIEHNK